MTESQDSIGTPEEFMDGVPADEQVMEEDLQILRDSGVLDPQVIQETQRVIDRVRRGNSDVFQQNATDAGASDAAASEPPVS